MASKYQAARSNPLEVEKKLKTRLYTTPPSLHSYPTHSPPSVSHLSYPLLPQSHTYHQSSLTPFPTHSSLTLTPFEPIPPSLAHLPYPLLLHCHTFPTHSSFTLTPFLPTPSSLLHLSPLLLHSHTFWRRSTGSARARCTGKVLLKFNEIIILKNKKISVFFLLFLLLFIKISIQPFPLSIAPFFQKKCKKPPSADFSCFSKR